MAWMPARTSRPVAQPSAEGTPMGYPVAVRNYDASESQKAIVVVSIPAPEP